MNVPNNCLYEKKTLVPLGFFVLSLTAYFLGYLVPIPLFIEAFNPPLSSGPVIASVFVLGFGMFPFSLTILYIFRILISRKPILSFGFHDSRYPISIIILMISAVWLSFGFGLALAGIRDSKIKLFAAYLIGGGFIFCGFLGLVMLAVDCVAYIRRRIES